MRLSEVEQFNRVMSRAIVELQSVELDSLLEAAYKVPSPEELSQKYYGGLTGLDAAMQRVVAGAGIAVAQTLMTRHASFGPEEFKKLLRVRKAFHPQMVAAAGTLANELEDTPARGVIPYIRRIAATRPGQEQKLVTSLIQFFVKTKGKLRPQDFENTDVRKAMYPMMRLVHLIDPGEHSDVYTYRDKERDVNEAFKAIIKFKAIPDQLKTIFRKVIKVTISGFAPYDFTTGFAKPGAWEKFSPEEKNVAKKEAALINEKEKKVFDIEDIEERNQAYRDLAIERTRLQNEAGVNIGVIERGDVPSVDSVLKAEKKQNRDAITEYVIEKFIQSKLSFAERYPEQLKNWGGKRALNKVINKLKKAKTLPTALMVVEDAVNRKQLSKENIKDFKTQSEEANRNLAVKEGIAIAPLDFNPMDKETFLERHGVGDVQFDKGFTEEERKNVLGRVSRALSDLETVYGSKVAARHAKKLNMIFEKGAGTGGGAAASYFGWDDPNNWQPRVKFGEDFDNLLAHELSHYFEDLIAFEIEKASKGADMPRYEFGDVAHGTGDIFGRTGVSIDIASDIFEKGLAYKPKSPGGKTWHQQVTEQVPELYEWLNAVKESDAHSRWKDLVPGVYDYVIDKAIDDVMGEMHWKEKDKITQATYKSELPPGVAERADELYTKMMGGDKRKLSYRHSVVETWARMCEQYVYTKLSRNGIANPWLTQMSYDPSIAGKEVFMEQDEFDRVMVPIYDRLFSRLRKKGMIGEDMMFISWSSLSKLLQEAFL